MYKEFLPVINFCIYIFLHEDDFQGPFWSSEKTLRKQLNKAMAAVCTLFVTPEPRHLFKREIENVRYLHLHVSLTSVKCNLHSHRTQ